MRWARTAMRPPSTIRATVPILNTVKDSLSRSVNLVLIELSRTMEMKAIAARIFSVGPSEEMDVTEPIDWAITMLWIAIDDGLTAIIYTQAMRKAAVSPYT
jgi:hypothetical protein